MKLVLLNAVAAATLALGTSAAFAQSYAANDAPPTVEHVAALQPDSLMQREDAIEDRINRETDDDRISLSQADRAKDRLASIRDEQARFDSDDGGLTVADSRVIQDRLDSLEHDLDRMG